MTMQTAYDKAPAKLGVNMNTRRERHGDEGVCAKDIRVKNYPLNKANLCGFFGDKHVWDMWFVEKGKNNPVEPFLHGRIGVSYDIVGKWKDSKVIVTFGLKPYTVTFTDCTISKVVMTRQVGGLVMMDFTISCLKRNISGELALLDDFLDCTLEVEMEFGPEDEDEDDEDAKAAAKKKAADKNQGELPIEAPSSVSRRRRKSSDGADEREHPFA
jgi:hypothetical protein